ncbi:MAG TPA: HDIG domain-containing protein [Rectinema sp.]|jgi:putative nucleotidyltransferase with HDIG domain|nr:HDIG domain-containing protein [Spirochaetia bacterium]HAL93811.1 hydrolase [Spirochaetaceae bacterium]HNV19236.1 HDIG domain-containing protein [Rectinema sp.]HNY99147.1 HDIG domain-containing protein [Rectinema sp.]HOH05694.1 HDIG domain-containing protein [Rectinema sp.]
MTRDEAVVLWKLWNSDESLWHHALSTEAVMRHFARKYGEDAEYWGIIGLLHDIDYEKFPEEHLKHAREILASAGFDDAFIRSVESHGWGICTQVEPKLLMEKVLFAADELTGFIAACSYVRPSRSVLDLEVKSVKKKWGSAAFAAGVRRNVIEQGAQMLGVPLDELIGETILALRGVASEIGLKGNL